MNSSFSKAHIEGRVREIQNLRNDIETFYSHVNKELSEISKYFAKHIWLDKNLLSEVTNALQTSLKGGGDKLLKRVTLLESGFKNLPLEAELTLSLDKEEVNDVIEGGEVV